MCQDYLSRNKVLGNSTQAWTTCESCSHTYTCMYSWIHLIVISWGSRSLKINMLAGRFTNLACRFSLAAQNSLFMFSFTPPGCMYPRHLYTSELIKPQSISSEVRKNSIKTVVGSILDFWFDFNIDVPIFMSICCSYTSSWLLPCCYLSELYWKRDG